MASQNLSNLIPQIYESRTILLDLMKSQGYNVSGYDGFSVNEVNTMKTNNQLDMILDKIETEKNERNEKNRKIYINHFLYIRRS